MTPTRRRPKTVEQVVCFCGKMFTRVVGGMGRPRLYCTWRCGVAARAAAEKGRTA